MIFGVFTIVKMYEILRVI